MIVADCSMQLLNKLLDPKIFLFDLKLKTVNHYLLTVCVVLWWYTQSFSTAEMSSSLFSTQATSLTLARSPSTRPAVYNCARSFAKW